MEIIKSESMRWSYFMLITMVFFSCDEMLNSNPIRTTRIYTGKYHDLMEAVKEEHLTKIEQVVTADHLNLNYADSINGVSLLNWCIFNEKEKSFEKLLQLGADPNWQDTASRFAPVIVEAARLDNTSAFLRLAIQYKGNVNLLSRGRDGAEEQSPLFSAIYSKRMESVKALVERGADVNLAPDSMWTPLAETLLHDKMEMAYYLLEHGADYTNLKFKTNLGKELNILDFLRENQFSLNSDEYKTKMKIVAYIKAKGLDYRAYPIPEKIKTQHQGDPEYLSRY